MPRDKLFTSRFALSGALRWRVKMLTLTFRCDKFKLFAIGLAWLRDVNMGALWSLNCVQSLLVFGSEFYSVFRRGN